MIICSDSRVTNMYSEFCWSTACVSSVLECSKVARDANNPPRDSTRFGFNLMLLIVIMKASCRVDGSRRHVVRRLTNVVSSAAIKAMAANIGDMRYIYEHDIL